jgi:hypothetical protein
MSEREHAADGRSGRSMMMMTSASASGGDGGVAGSLSEVQRPTGSSTAIAKFCSTDGSTPKFVSPSDPAAQWTGAMRGPAFFAYADNYLIDVKFGVIMDVEASRAIRQAEVGASQTMIERTEACFGIKPE